MAVFWMIAVLGMVLFAATKMLHADTSGARVTRDRMFAKRFAEMGLEVGRHPGIELYDPLLSYSGENGGSFQVQIIRAVLPGPLLCDDNLQSILSGLCLFLLKSEIFH